MDSDHDGGSGGGAKDAWPRVVNDRKAEPDPVAHISASAPPHVPAQAQGPTSPQAGAEAERREGPPGAEAPGAEAPAGKPEAEPPEPGPEEPGPEEPGAEEPGAPEAGSLDAGSPQPAAGMAALSFPFQIVAAVALAGIGLLAVTQLAMVFLHVAPSNTLTKQHGKTVDDWIYPEFEQNWKLFAPNPLQQNVAVQVRADVSRPEGPRTTGWISLTGEDGEAIRGNPFPSHVRQNELRRGWDFYVNSHDAENRPNGLRGELSERYVRRIAMLRLSGRDLGGAVERIQMRSVTTPVAPPVWSTETAGGKPSYRVLPWWDVTPDDLPASSRTAHAEEGDK
ncbi:hypothetical protein EES43_13960 [Streptomyces sp. ADI96-02]|uniref:DUF5819 family protein n=1 Tax=Streptomyces sp. ADI96-02 TaxID=1522760 RepID=UPI000FA339C9|nr:DUF5819 family protein [Streptomyces sp. ADI96-02]RPK62335.1 hypothetical protein EES43_13960 [Streptomyces sp. ADI96-02]